MKFLKIAFHADTEESLDSILEYMKTTLDRNEIVTEDGFTYIEILTDAELVDELICLGGCLLELDNDGYEDAFFVEIVELDVAPVDCDAPPQYLQ